MTETEGDARLPKATESTLMRDGLIAVDWGTTNRRVFALDATGTVERREADALGVTAIPPGGFPAAMADLRARFGARPILLAGMIGSTRGWIEAPYVACPLTLDRLAAALVWVEPGQIAIVPGASMLSDAAADVMRGEEVQLLGAVAAGLVGPDAGLCLPGTHAKWARLQDGALTDFRTVMTGELFALLRGHSILSAQLQGKAEPGAAFLDGVRRSLHGRGVIGDLFGIRARSLLGRLSDADAPSYLSGLLIGADVAIGCDLVPDGEIALIGDPALTRLYGAALDEARRASREIDGEEAFLAGIRALAERIG